MGGFRDENGGPRDPRPAPPRQGRWLPAALAALVVGGSLACQAGLGGSVQPGGDGSTMPTLRPGPRPRFPTLRATSPSRPEPAATSGGRRRLASSSPGLLMPAAPACPPLRRPRPGPAASSHARPLRC